VAARGNVIGIRSDLKCVEFLGFRAVTLILVNRNSAKEVRKKFYDKFLMRKTSSGMGLKRARQTTDGGEEGTSCHRGKEES
jgi:hypothetical protein